MEMTEHKDAHLFRTFVELLIVDVVRECTNYIRRKGEFDYYSGPDELVCISSAARLAKCYYNTKSLIATTDAAAADDGFPLDDAMYVQLKAELERKLADARRLLEL